MLTRRSLLGSAAATPLIWNTAFADTPKDVAVMAMQIDDIISLDPGEAFEFSGNEIGSNCYEKLVEPDGQDPTKINGVLASHWEVAGDGLTYTFYLKQDRKFASGNLVTAADVAWSLQRAVTMDKAPGFILTQFGFTKDNAAARIKAMDDHTVVMQIAEATAPTFLLYCLSANVGSVIEKQVALSHAENDDLGNGWLKGASAGSNAWAVRSWKASDSVVLDAVAGGPAKLKRMVIRHVAEPSTQLLLLQKGDADIVRNLNPEQLKAVRGKPEYHADIQEPGHGELHRAEPDRAGTGASGRGAGDEMGDRLRRDRQEHHARHLRDAPGLPARWLPGRGEATTRSTRMWTRRRR